MSAIVMCGTRAGGQAARMLGAVALVGVVVGVLMVLGVAPAAAADYTWAPGGQDQKWSTGANWAGGAAPSGSVGTLTFPGGACGSMCNYATFDDIDGLTASTLAITVGPGTFIPAFGSQDQSGLPSKSLALTSGMAIDNQLVSQSINLRTPLVLAGPNTWNVTHGDFSVTGGVSGSQPLTVNLPGSQQLGFGLEGASNDVGPVSITGTGGGSYATVTGGHPPDYGDGDLNGTNGNPVVLKNLHFLAIGTFGALSTSQVTLDVGVGANQGASATHRRMQVTSAAFSPDTRIAFALNPAGSTPGVDYGQITSSGTIDLGGASPAITTPNGECPPMGSTYTIVSTTGTLTGNFAPFGTSQGSPDDYLVNAGCGQYSEISYHMVTSRTGATKTVTATVGPPFKPKPRPHTAPPPEPAAIKAALRRIDAPPAATSVRSLLAKGATLKFPAPGAGNVSLRWSVGSAATKKPLVLAKITRKISKSGTVKLLVRPTKAGKRALRSAKKAKRALRVKSTVSFRPKDSVGEDGSTVRSARTKRNSSFKLKR